MILVGCGRAGAIHARALDRSPALCRSLYLVDLAPEPAAALAAGLCRGQVCRDLEAAIGRGGAEAVVDLCVPAPAHAAVVRQARSLGLRRFLLEKPLGWSLSAARQLARLLGGCDARYLDTYAASAGIELLEERIAQHAQQLRALSLRFAKDRRSDAAAGRGFAGSRVPNAWLVEGPHLASIALRLGGGVTAVRAASAQDMRLPGRRLPAHGGGRAILQHVGGLETEISIDLCADHPERSVRACLDDGTTLSLCLPLSGSPSQRSTLKTVLPDGHAASTTTLDDRPLEQCLTHGLSRLLEGAAQPGSLKGGLAVIRLLDAIMRASRPADIDCATWPISPRPYAEAASSMSCPSRRSSTA